VVKWSHNLFTYVGSKGQQRIMWDLATLARVQFAVTASFHYIYPPLSIGLGWFLVLLEGMYLRTGNKLYHDACKFWVGIFGLIFGIGVATGIVMEFEFGTNWATYSRYVGDIFGSALASEGLFAFFLESGFFSVLVFGWDRVSKGMHFFATLMVALGATFSAVWIVIANSWQQTPAGFHIVGQGMTARAEIVDFWAMVFNPSSMERLSHVLGGALMAGAFLALSVGAFYLLGRKHAEHARRWMPLALSLAIVGMGVQFISGHGSAVGVAKNQPAKLAAFEGHWDSTKPGNLYLFGWVDDARQMTHGLALNGGASFLLTQDFTRPMTGLNSFKPADRPLTNPTFQTYHIMLYCAGAMAALLGISLLFYLTGSFFRQTWLLQLWVPAVLLPQLANQAGWFSAEMGRQPWVVYNLLRTSDALSKAVTANQVLASLIMFTLVYALLFALFVFLLNHKIRVGPAGQHDHPSTHAPQRRADAV
jgi:cytochrome bd ubiquinol oxidase subunit I